MNFKFIINLIIMIFFLSCDNTSTNPENETTTTGGDSENNLIEIYYGSSNQEGQLSIANPNLDDVAGFQFDLSGVTLSGASGGSADAAGFTTSASGNTVLGFSFTGGTIPPGNGLLTELTFTANEGEIEACLEGPVMSDSAANAIEFEIGDCEIVASLAGCMDETACNYNANANEDDGSCWYVGVDNDYCDCDMNINDCAGDDSDIIEVKFRIVVLTGNQHLLLTAFRM